jgi:multidrug resistance efflux pump
MSNEKPKILYSDPVNEIISVPPRRIVRFGTVFIFGIFVLLLLFSWLIQYPDTVPATIEITTTNPPVTLVSKISGRINDFYVKDGEKVDSGKLLAVMETAASIKEVYEMKHVVDEAARPSELDYKKLPLLSGLGEIQPYYASFLKAFSDFDTYVRNDVYANKIKSKKKEIAVLEGYMRGLVTKEKIILENLALEERQFRRDTTLFQGEVVTDSEIEKSKQSLNKSKLELQQVRLDQSQASLNLSEMNQLLMDYVINEKKEKQSFGAALDESFQNLKAQIKIWENNYLLIAQVTGTITITRIWSKNQMVTENQPVITIVPDNLGEFIGRITLKMNRSGQVEKNMPVNIKLSGYPYIEYGMLRGVVRSKSVVASGDAYIIEVSLPQGLTTLYGKKLDFTQDMQGQAEIITKKLRLIQRIINPFRYLISRNKS